MSGDLASTNLKSAYLVNWWPFFTFSFAFFCNNSTSSRVRIKNKTSFPFSEDTLYIEPEYKSRVKGFGVNLGIRGSLHPLIELYLHTCGEQAAFPLPETIIGPKGTPPSYQATASL